MRPLISALLLFWCTCLRSQGEAPAFKVMKAGQPLGAAVILLPGLGCGGEVWDGVTQALAPHSDVHVMTYAGFAGERPRMDKGSFAATLAEDLAAYCRREGLKRPLLVGHGFGGYLALRVAILHPGLPGGVLALDAYPAMIPPVPGLSESTRASIGAQILDTLRSASTDGTFAQVQGHYLREMAGPNPRTPTYLDMLKRSDPPTQLRAMEAMVREDLEGRLSAYSGPLTVLLPVVDLATLGGFREGSAGLTAEEMRQQALSSGRLAYAKAPQAKIQVVEGSRHFVMDDQPKALIEAIRSMLVQSSAEGPRTKG